MRRFIAVIVASVLLFAACGQATSSVTVTMDEWSIKPSQASVPAGPVTFIVTNAGKERHELAVLKTDIAPDKLSYRAADPKKAEEPGNVGEIEDIAAGTTKQATFDLKTGNHVLICNEPDHYKAGMRMAFTVR